MECHKYICTEAPVVKSIYKQDNIVNRLFSDEFYFSCSSEEIQKYYNYKYISDENYSNYVLDKEGLNIKELVVIYSSIINL